MKTNWRNILLLLHIGGIVLGLVLHAQTQDPILEKLIVSLLIFTLLNTLRILNKPL
jgi:uncharacterized membrane protein YfcA